MKSLSYLEIDTKAFRNNLKQMSSVLSPQVKRMLILKGNAYGHGLVAMAKIALEEGVSHFGVVSMDEAIKLRSSNISVPILLLSEVEENLIPDLFHYQITPTVYQQSFAKKLSEFAIKSHHQISVHIKIDIGLNRFGFKGNPVDEIIRISKLNNIFIEGIYTHFADAIDDTASASKQLELFNKICSQLESKNISIKIKHSANSPALVWVKGSHLDLVRFGLAAYGLQPSVAKKYPLVISPVMSWKTKIMQIKKVSKGEYISYGKSFKTNRDITIAVIGVGYADGFRRSPLSYQNVLIRGVKVPIVGNVTMNFTMIDISGLKTVKLYDEVVLIGKQKNSRITLEEAAIRAETINEEVATSISALIPRLYI